jgi:NagD protein
MTERGAPGGHPVSTVAARLARVRGWVFDMDGTLVLGDRANHGLAPLPGAAGLLAWARERGVPYVVFTNGTNRAPAHFARVLRDAGLDVPDDQMMTPASSAAVMLARRGHKRVMLLGGEGLAAPLREAGIEVVPPAGDGSHSPGGEPPDAVLVGWFPEFTMPALEAATRAVWDGARLYSASQTPFFAAAGGRALGTSRAICAMITSLTGCRVTVTGKPSLDALRAAAARLGGLPLSALAVVVDDPLLEVPMAHRGSALAIAVQTGLAGPDAYDHLPEGKRPHLHLRGVDELLSLLNDPPVPALFLLPAGAEDEREPRGRLYRVRWPGCAARDHGALPGAGTRAGPGPCRGGDGEPDRPGVPGRRAGNAPRGRAAVHPGDGPGWRDRRGRARRG